MEAGSGVTGVCPGFGAESEVLNADVSSYKTNKFKKNKDNRFDALKISLPLLQGIKTCGYKSVTQVQKLAIPLAMEGRDVVVMAKTGSGKTACFLIPLLEKLRHRDANRGVRALILTPTRELAMQTLRFARQIGKHTGLNIIPVLGGDSLETQFSAMHTSPDVVIATPGRFLHLCVEMDLKLSSVEFLVFDEADRLFELGFKEQLTEILNRLPESRQTMILSATLPKLLIDFAKAGLNDPALIRLDIESKIPQDLELKFVYCRPNERYSVLIGLLKYILAANKQAMIFVGTQYHVQFISDILHQNNIENASIYSNMDSAARKINTAKFIHKKVPVLIVTDVAARGIDIPALDYVVNFHFPGSPKLFVHRVGRCARAGRRGTAYSIVSKEDEGHLLDLHLFLNRTFDKNNVDRVPKDILEELHESFLKLLKNSEMASHYKICENGYKKYISSRPVCSNDSKKEAKNIQFSMLQPLSDFMKRSSEPDVENTNSSNVCMDDNTSKNYEEDKKNWLHHLKIYRPKETIFDISSSKSSSIMKQGNAERLAKTTQNRFERYDEVMSNENKNNMELNDDNENAKSKHNEYYISHQPIDKHTEEGLAVNNFTSQAQNAELNIIDKFSSKNNRKIRQKWDRVKKKMVTVQDSRSEKILTESGVWIPKTYKAGIYKQWKEKNKVDSQSTPREGNVRPGGRSYSADAGNFRSKNEKSFKHQQKELKTPEQMLKRRLRVEIAQERELQNKMKKLKRNRTKKS